MAAGHGFIIPVGGAEEKIGDVTILRRFASLCGPGGRIAIIPTASELNDTGHRYETLFRELGAAQARFLPIHEREDAERQELLDILDESDGVFLTGGNQLRLSTMIGGTSMAKALRWLLKRGQALERVLPAFTANPARVLQLHRKGHLRPGADADLVVLDAQGAVADVMARGRWLVREGRAIVRGAFEEV